MINTVNSTQVLTVALVCGACARLGSDDAAFLAEYPEAKKGVRELVEAIRKNNIASGIRAARRSKNGTPAERMQKSSDVEDPETTVLA